MSLGDAGLGAEKGAHSLGGFVSLFVWGFLCVWFGFGGIFCLFLCFLRFFFSFFLLSLSSYIFTE